MSKFFKTDTANEWDKERKRTNKKSKKSTKKQPGATNMVITQKMDAGENYQQNAPTVAKAEQTAYVPLIPPAPKPRNNRPFPQPKTKSNVKPRPTTFRPTASAATRPVAAPQQVA